LAEEREEVLDALFGHLTERFAEMYTRLYLDNHRAVGALIDTGLKVPWEFRMAAEYVLSRQLNEVVRSQKGSHDPCRYREAQEVVAEAQQRGYRLDQSESEAIFEEMITEGVRSLVKQPTDQGSRRVIELIDLAHSLEVSLELGESQDILFEMIQNKTDELYLMPQIQDLLQRTKLSNKLLPKRHT
jgi:hypothetical protein